MKAIITVRHPARESDTHMLVDAEPDTPMADIVREIQSGLGAPQAAGDSLGIVFAGSGLVDGAVLTFGANRPAPVPTNGRVDIRFVAGVNIGRMRRLRLGETLIGLDDDDIPVFGSLIPDERRAAVVTVDIAGRVSVRALTPVDLSSPGIPMLLESTEVTVDTVVWDAGRELHLGRSVLAVHPVTLSDAELIHSPETGWLDYNRPPRMLPPVTANSFRLPAAPAPPTRNSLPWITAMIPAVMGVTMAVLMKQPFYLLFALMSPVMMLGSHFSARSNGKKSHRRLSAEHVKNLADITVEVADAVDAEQHRRRSDAPDAAELLVRSSGPTYRLWERRTADPDHLLIRVGTADLPSSVKLEDLSKLEHRRKSSGTTQSVPVTLSVAEAGVIGVAGQGRWPRAIGSWVVGQLAVLQSPRDLQIYILTSTATADDWNWAHWLPHVRPALGQDAISLIGTSSETLGRRVAELGQLVADRMTAGSGVGSTAQRFVPEVLVVLDGARRLRAMPGIVSLLRDGPGLGVHILCLDAEERQLPEECTAVIVERSIGTLVVKQNGVADIDGVLTDVIVDSWFQDVARSLSPMRDVSPSESDGLVPQSANLLEVLGLESLTGELIAAKWSAGGRSTKAVIGVSLDGPFALDLVRDGPHGLVAGTTGSGKSEFLQTLVASLALANRPDAMTFVLIDYKGGAAFSGCVDLPHTVGMVTDLDSHLVERALNSLRAELVRREQVLGSVGAKDLEDYLVVIDSGGRGIRLPRLVIVIDEFAAMAKELPDFVAGLISIAQRGRSLGVHLVMATQRPSGVISPEIRANTNLRVALRMTDAGESSDVIDIPDSARISKAIPGRAYARLGHASIIPFQTARIGGARAIPSEARVRSKPFVAPLSWEQFSLPLPQPPKPVSAMSQATDLSVLVAAVRDATALLGIEPQRSPWLPPLPDTISLESLMDGQSPLERASDLASSGPKITWAREDIPSSQQQRDAVLDLTRFGHLFIVGGPGSGRSQALRTIAASAAGQSTLNDVHLYGIDCGNGALTSLAALPHCGAVAQRNQPERASRLIQRLQAEVLRRHELLGAGTYANITEQRLASGESERIPHILVLIDRWENFTTTLGELDGGLLTDIVQSLLRDGASAGVHLVIAGDRSLLGSRMGVLTEDKILLRLTDRLDYSLANLNYKTIPAEIPPGRGYRAGSGIELQVALLGTDPSGQAQTEAVQCLGRALTAQHIGTTSNSRPFRVDDLPSVLDLRQAFELSGQTPPLWGLIGVGGDQLLAQGIDLAQDTPTFLVAGPARSGRSTLLGVMASSLLRGGAELVLVCPRPSPLRALAGTPGVRAVLTDPDLAETDLAPHLDPDGRPVVLIVDDGEMVMDAPAKLWLRAYIRTAVDHQRGLILAGSASEVGAGFSGWQVDVKKNRRGALLSPQNSLDGDLVGVRLPRSNVTSRVTPGRAFVHLGSGELMTVQIPSLASEAPFTAP